MSSPGHSLRAPLLWLLLPGLVGIAAAEQWPLPARLLPGVALAAAGLAGAAYRLNSRSGAGWAGALVASAFLAGYLGLRGRTPDFADWLVHPREVTVSLAVDQCYPAAPARKTWSGLGRIVAADGLVREVTGQRVYFTVLRRGGPAPAPGGRYTVRGVLQGRPDDGDPRGFQRHLAALGIRLMLGRGQVVREERAPGVFRRFCARAETRLEAVLRTGLQDHPATASVYLAMLLGAKAELSPEQETAFMRSGTFHLFSISGLHVGVIAVAIQSLLVLLRVPRRPATAAGLAVLGLYVQVTGASAPAMRAFLMIAFLLGARMFRLPGNPLAALTAAALVTLALDPRQLFSTGFQMSYGVVAALIAMGGPLGARWREAWSPWRYLPPADWRWWQRGAAWAGRKGLAAVAATWVALLASTVTGVAYFGLFSPGALVANLLIIPLSSLALAAGFASLVCGLAGGLTASSLFNHAAALTIVVMDWLVQHGTELPGVYFPAEFRAPWLAPLAQGLVLAVILLGASLGWPRRSGAFWWPALTVALVLILGVKFG